MCETVKTVRYPLDFGPSDVKFDKIQNPKPKRNNWVLFLIKKFIFIPVHNKIDILCRFLPQKKRNVYSMTSHCPTHLHYSNWSIFFTSCKCVARERKVEYLNEKKVKFNRFVVLWKVYLMQNAKGSINAKWRQIDYIVYLRKYM